MAPREPSSRCSTRVCAAILMIQKTSFTSIALDSVIGEGQKCSLGLASPNIYCYAASQSGASVGEAGANTPAQLDSNKAAMWHFQPQYGRGKGQSSLHSIF